MHSVVHVNGERTMSCGIDVRVVRGDSRGELGGVHVVLAGDRPGGFWVVVVGQVSWSITCRTVDVKVVVVDHRGVEGVVDSVVVVAYDDHVRVLVVHFVGAVSSQTIESCSDIVPRSMILVSTSS